MTVHDFAVVDGDGNTQDLAQYEDDIAALL